MGTLAPGDALEETICQAARCAARQDPRFPPLTLAELPDVRISVSVLAPPAPMKTIEDLVLGRHGIIVRAGERHGLFLPEVATQHRFDQEAFLTRCCIEKAGLPGDAWRQPGTEVFLFTTETSREPD
jgi:AmmeMemoRadiSam system protein A